MKKSYRGSLTRSKRIAERYSTEEEFRKKRGKMNQLTLEGKKAMQKPIVKRKGTIKIDFLTYDDNSEKHLKKFRENNTPLPKIKGFSVDFDGWNEKSGSPCKDEEEVKKQVKHLIENNKEKYNLEVIDNRIKETKICKEEKVKDFCVVCKKNEKSDNWNDEVKGMCEECKGKHYKKVFEDLDIPNGFKDLGESYKFYSFTTGEEEVRKDRILSVLGGKQSIQTCDEFGCFVSCFGVTEDFCNHLIKELKLVEKIEGDKSQIEFNGEELHTSWRNPKIKEDETSKKIAELKKELAIQKVEMMTKLKEIKELEYGKKEKK